MQPAVTSPRSSAARAHTRAIWLGLGALLLLAAALRLWGISRVPGNVFYDAAVRSMGASWHNFFFGALEPGGSVAIDKPPVDLWLQVIATRVIGFTLFSLHLPEALAGVAACGLLFGALRRPFGTGAALAAALALAVLPISVLTARSDTMDSVLAALEVAALWCSWRALESGRLRWSVAAAAVMGLAFNVKLAEMLIALPAMGLLWLWAAPPGRRVRAVLLTACAFAAVALSWTALASLTPARERPFPIGSRTGSVWHVTLVYNGLERLSSSHSGAGGAGPLRLFESGSRQYLALIGVALLAALLAAAAALATLVVRRRARAPVDLHSPRARLAVGIALWFALGAVTFSAMERLQARYLEAFAPALCAVLGISAATLWRRARPPREPAPEGSVPRATAGLAGPPRAAVARVLLLCVGVGLLAASLTKDLELVESHRSDSLQNDRSTLALSRYLRDHRDGARFYVVGANVNDILGLVTNDGLPVLVLNSIDGSLTRTRALQRIVAEGAARYYFVAPHPCHAGRQCPHNQIWAYAHSIPVRGQPALRRFTRATAKAGARLAPGPVSPSLSRSALAVAAVR